MFRKKILKEGIRDISFPLIVKRTKGRAWLNDGNHRTAALKTLNVEWVPITASYPSILKADGYQLINSPVPRVYDSIEDWPDHPTACSLGFKTDFFERHSRNDVI